MAQFGKRFRKARKRRQKARRQAVADIIEARQETKRVRSQEKTKRVQARQQGKSDRVASKSMGGFYLPESVQARQSSLMQGLKTAGTLGLAAATGGASEGALATIGALGSAFGGMGGSPYGNGFVTSGLESEYYGGDVQPKEEDKIFGLDPMLVYLAGGGLVLYLFTRRK